MFKVSQLSTKTIELDMMELELLESLVDEKIHSLSQSVGSAAFLNQAEDIQVLSKLKLAQYQRLAFYLKSQRLSKKELLKEELADLQIQLEQTHQEEEVQTVIEKLAQLVEQYNI